ncbi:MAG: molybdopterin-dependent oxidoreductase [Halieaceae bacterium]|nr:molybdopterin-dependent oxidoreductase [Halieaceae bacterium]
MTKQVKTFCRICDPACPLTASVDDSGSITQLEPDREHPVGGIACHKGLSYLDLHRDQDRLNAPLRRENAKGDAAGIFEEVSWDTATRECAERLRAIISEHGPNAVAIYSGNPGVYNARGMTYGGAFSKMLGTSMMFSANTQDMSNRMVAAAGLYGSLSIMTPDLVNTDYLICMGSNPRVSKWTVFSTPNDSGRTMEAVKQRGGKICFVNPRVTESSTPETGETLLIKPGADVYFLAAVLHELNVTGALDQEVIARWGVGMEEALAFASQYPAERVQGVTGIAASEIKAVAADFRAAGAATIYVSVGVNQGRQGLLAAWLADLIVFATGNLGKRGGMYKPTGLADFYPPMPIDSISVDTSLGELRYTMGGPAPLPTIALAELINNGDIKALVSLAGNPLLSAAGEDQLREAFSKLELLIAVDIQRNATAEASDYVLPATDFLERADINFVAKGLQPIPYVQYTDPVVQPAHERRDDWRILTDIAREMGAYQGEDPDGWGIVNQMLAMDELSIDDLKAMPHQTKIFENTPHDDLFKKCLKHADGKVHCFPPEFVGAGIFERSEAIFQELDLEPDNALKMISMRTAYMHNSWMSNLKKFRRGAQSTNPLHLNPGDAAQREVADGDKVRVFNQYGSIETRVRLDESLRPGAVAMTHGYGGGRGAMRIAEANPGANPNKLVPNTMDTVEPLSNMSWIGAYPVEVEKVG